MSDVGLSGEDAELVRDLREEGADAENLACGELGLRAAKRIEALSAELATLRAALDDTKAPWRPIESAPKDGTFILVATSGAVRKHGNHDCWITSWREQWSDTLQGNLQAWWVRNNLRVDDATHWMPLPAAPEAEP